MRPNTRGHSSIPWKQEFGAKITFLEPFRKLSLRRREAQQRADDLEHTLAEGADRGPILAAQHRVQLSLDGRLVQGAEAVSTVLEQRTRKRPRKRDE